MKLLCALNCRFAARQEQTGTEVYKGESEGGQQEPVRHPCAGYRSLVLQASVCLIGAKRVQTVDACEGTVWSGVRWQVVDINEIAIHTWTCFFPGSML